MSDRTTHTVPAGAATLGLVDVIVALVLAGYAAVYLFFFLALAVFSPSPSGKNTSLMFVLGPILMGASAFLGLYSTWRLSKDRAAIPGLLVPVALVGTASVFIWVWFSGGSETYGVMEVLVPGLLAAWVGGRLLAQRFMRRRLA